MGYSGITQTLGGSYSGRFFPVQSIYGGKTHRSLPDTTLAPPDWDFRVTETHWANLNTYKLYINHIVRPYTVEILDDLCLESEQKFLTLYDGWFAHRKPAAIGALEALNCVNVQIPFGTTGECQAMDVSVNKPWKDGIKNGFDV